MAKFASRSILVAAAVATAAGLAMWRGCVQDPSAEAHDREQPSSGVQRPEPRDVQGAVNRLSVPETPGADGGPPGAAPEAADSVANAGPDTVALPGIGDRPASEDEAKMLRMVLHEMHRFGMDLTLPKSLDPGAWEGFSGVIRTMVAGRKVLQEQLAAVLTEEVARRLSTGAFEVHANWPAPRSRNEYLAYRNTYDSTLGKMVVHVVRVREGELAANDLLNQKIDSVDRDMATLARGFFSQFQHGK